MINLQPNTKLNIDSSYNNAFELKHKIVKADETEKEGNSTYVVTKNGSKPAQQISIYQNWILPEGTIFEHEGKYLRLTKPASMKFLKGRVNLQNKDGGQVDVFNDFYLAIKNKIKKFVIGFPKDKKEKFDDLEDMAAVWKFEGVHPVNIENNHIMAKDMLNSNYLSLFGYNELLKTTYITEPQKIASEKISEDFYNSIQEEKNLLLFPFDLNKLGWFLGKQEAKAMNLMVTLTSDSYNNEVELLYETEAEELKEEEIKECKGWAYENFGRDLQALNNKMVSLFNRTSITHKEYFDVVQTKNNLKFTIEAFTFNIFNIIEAIRHEFVELFFVEQYKLLFQPEEKTEEFNFESEVPMPINSIEKIVALGNQLIESKDTQLDDMNHLFETGFLLKRMMQIIIAEDILLDDETYFKYTGLLLVLIALTKEIKILSSGNPDTVAIYEFLQYALETENGFSKLLTNMPISETQLETTEKTYELLSKEYKKISHLENTIVEQQFTVIFIMIEQIRNSTGGSEDEEESNEEDNNDSETKKVKISNKQ